MIVTFSGERSAERHVIYADDKRIGLFLDECNHSPDGFEWGYGGSGPAQSAYAILRTFFEDYFSGDIRKAKHFAFALHQDFKFKYVAGFDKDEWQILGKEIETWLLCQLRYLRELKQWDETLARIRDEETEGD
jgi:hypothetical protein